LLLPYFLLANYTLNKTFSLEGKEAQNGGGKFSKIGEPQPKTEGKLDPILIPNLAGIEATCGLD